MFWWNSYLSHQNLIMDEADYIPYQFIVAHITIKSIYSPLLKETNNMSDKWIDIKYGTWFLKRPPPPHLKSNPSTNLVHDSLKRPPIWKAAFPHLLSLSGKNYPIEEDIKNSFHTFSTPILHPPSPFIGSPHHRFLHIYLCTIVEWLYREIKQKQKRSIRGCHD